VAVVTNNRPGRPPRTAQRGHRRRHVHGQALAGDVVLPTGSAVLNAGDPLVAKMAPLCAGSVIFFALDGTHPDAAAASQQGKRVVFVRDGQLILCEGSSETISSRSMRSPSPARGRAPFQVENALAAASAAWALGLSKEAIRTSLEIFRADRQDDPLPIQRRVPWRSHLVIDDCHNISALAAVVSALDRFPHRKRTAVYSAGGREARRRHRSAGRDLGPGL